MGILAEVNQTPSFLKLLQTYNDAFEASVAVGDVAYEKKEGKLKPCVVAFTMLHCYVLKGDKTLKRVAIFPVATLAARFEGRDKLMLTAGDEVFPLWGEGIQAVHAALGHMRDRGEQLQDAAREAADRAADEPSSGDENACDDGDDDRLDKGTKPAAAAHNDPAPEADDAPGLHETTAGPGGFLVNNIVSADFVDYSAVRSIYPLKYSPDEERGPGSASRGLITQLEGFIAAEQARVEKVVCENAFEFMTSVEQCEALKPGETQALHDFVEGIAAHVYDTAGSLCALGQGVVEAEEENRLVQEALQQTRLCHSAATLHRKAETLLAEGKYYPALNAAQELEEHARALLSHSYGQWVFHEALPALRQRIKQQVQYDFNAWLTMARQVAYSIGTKALDWAAQRTKASHGVERKVAIVEHDDDEDETTSARYHSSRCGAGAMRQRSLRLGGNAHGTSFGGVSFTENLSMSFCDDQTEDAQDDWALDMLWEVESQDTQAPAGLQQPIGAAQFLELLSDEMINPAEGPALKVVHTAMRVFQTLDPASGEAQLRRYYTENRKRQLALTLESMESCSKEKDWLAGITGFFLVDLVVAKSTYPPLCQTYHTQGEWDDAVLCIEEWMNAANAKYTSWIQLDWIKSMGLHVAVALEELWAVGGDANLRLDPIYTALSNVRRCAMKELHVNTMRSIDAVLASESYQLVTAHSLSERDLYWPKYKALFLHLASTGEKDAMPKCSVTVPNVVELLLNTMDIAFQINRGAGDVDDEVRGLVDSLLQHIASQLDEKTGKLSRVNTVHIAIQSTNAGAYDAAVLSLTRKYACKASGVYVNDGRLNIFAASRRRFRDCQRRFESRATENVTTQVGAYLSAITSDMWPTSGKANRHESPLVELQVDVYLQNNWTTRAAMLSNALCARMKQVEVDAVDSHLVTIAAALHMHGVQPVVQLQKDVFQFRNALHVPLPKFEAKVKALMRVQQVGAVEPGLQGASAVAAAAVPVSPSSPTLMKRAFGRK
eukprot:TRINITY_DN16160_c0_g1_i1.p1 TRINITY_DN16160_c0_g1~~TRINITY_DN16160_c0_g1_i1.p1  ORF type:complete len:1006 (+),score=328.79 TRINITY_DN16160_c0_g1_i1:130-3147(+)